jgi:hypothetical protein
MDQKQDAITIHSKNGEAGSVNRSINGKNKPLPFEGKEYN